MQRPVSGGLMTLACAAWYAAAAQAQETAPMQSVTVTGSSAAYDPRRDDTASKIVIGQEDLARYGDPSVAEALKRAPGVTVVTNGRGVDVRMRGLGAGYTRILLNGERPPLGFSVDALAPAQVERIEILRSASAEYTTESIAGTINIVLKKTISKAQRELQLNAEKDKADHTARTLLQLADRNGMLSWSVSARTRHTFTDRHVHTDEEGPGMQREADMAQRIRFTLYSVIARLQWTFPDKDSLVAQGYYEVLGGAWDSRETARAVLGDAPRFAVLEQHSRPGNAQLNGDVTWTHRLQGGGRIELKAGAQDADIDGRLRQLGYAPALSFDNTVASHTAGRNQNLSLKYFETLGNGHNLAAGWELKAARRTERRSEHETVDAAYPGSDEQSTAETRRLALFAQDEWPVTPAWSVYLGARMEALRTDSSGSAFDAARSHARIWSPIFQTLYKLRPEAGDQLRFALTRTFKAPDTEDLIPRLRRAADNTANTPDARGNPALKPELATGIDASYEYYWAKGAMLSAAVSVRRIDDATVTRTARDANGRWVAVPVNAGTADVRSLELESRFPLRALVAEAPAMDIKASVARNWSRVDAIPGPGNRLAQQIPLSATFSVDRSSGRFSHGASFVFRDGGWTRRSDLESSYLPARRELDVYGLWKFNPQTQLRIFLGNLLRANDTTARRYAAVTRTARIAGYPRLRLSLEHKF